MGQEQRSTKPARAGHEPAILIGGRSFTLSEAGALAFTQQNQRRFEVAAAIYDLILAQAPDYAEVHNNRGVCLQAMKRLEEALASFDQAIAFKPGYVNAHNNRAAILKEMKRYDEALEGYDQTLALKPDHDVAYNNRGAVLQKLNRHEEALASIDKAIALKPDYINAHHNRGAALEQLKRYDEALASYDRAIALKPDYVEAYNNRGLALQKMDRRKEALASYDQAIALKPGYAKAHNNRGAVLQKLKRYDQALASCDRAIALEPDNAEFHNNRGTTLQEMKRDEEALASYGKAITLRPDHGEFYNNRGITLRKIKLYDEALASFDRAITLQPDRADFHHNRGLVWINKGDMQEAEKMFHKALELKPDFPEPLSSLAGIRKFKSEDDVDVKQMQTLLDSPDTPPDSKEYLYFSLGKIYDDCGLHDEAFECYRQGNEMCNANVSYSACVITETADGIRDIFSRDFLAQPFAFASASRSPLFVVGMPRSGTTLMASILSNHRSIGTAGELPTIAEFVLSLPALTGTGIPYPQAVKQLTPDLATRLIHDYEKRLRRDIGPEIPHVVDKHPLNFWHLGFIAMLFPQARIIHCTRHPLDTCLSNYFQRFGLQYDYSFDLRNIGHYYVEYARIMEHWRKVLPLKMIEVSYEEVVSNTEPTARKLLDFIGLHWDERCLAPHTNPAPVETASQWQVRQPIYHQSLERWRHYEKHLGPLKEILLRSGHITA